MNEIVSFAPGAGRRVQPRARVATSAPLIDLSGAWRFCFSSRPELAPEGAAAVDFDDSTWDDIPVPSHWVLQGRPEWGQPVYTNVKFPFPVEPPFVPDENPTGDYRTWFELPEGFGERIFLRFDGVESLAIVSLNGVQVGVIRGSRLTQELDVTAEAHPGRNLLHVRVHQFSAATYLEDQDQWWLPGIFRPVAVLARPSGAIDDAWLRADYDPATGRGRIAPEVRAGEAAFPVRLVCAELGVDVTFASATEVAPVEVGAVEPWSADVPRRYAVELISQGETLTLKVGFRRIEIVGHEWRVNGRKLRLRGVNRHDYDPDEGRVFDAAKVRAQLELMKRHNINALRTSHYPPHPELLDLTDELGLWVIDECDLETHGFELNGWVDNPSDDPRWREALLDRIERFVERDKNHPSVISWSLGNESGTGANLAAMSAWVRRRDPERPVHYEGDYEGRYTDVVSRMYATVEEMEDLSAGVGRSRFSSAGRAAELAKRPMVQCEYVHAMGNGAGGIADYEERFDSLPQWHGGFVWEWRDHGLRTRTADGVEYFGYGGDFGEPFHDGSFVCDGLLLADGTATPALAEYAAVVTPIKLAVGAEELTVESRRHAGTTADLEFLWRDEVDGVAVAGGEVAVPAVAPGERRSVPLPAAAPAAGELWRTVEARLAAATPWAPAGHVVSRTQARLAAAPPKAPVPTGGGAPIKAAGAYALGPARFDALTGELIGFGELAIAGPRLSLWRAPTENDRLAVGPSYVDVEPTASRGVGDPGGPSSEEQWRAAGLDRVLRRVVSVTAAPDELVVLQRYAPAATREAVLVELRWSWAGECLRLAASAAPTAGWEGTWPRVGLHFALPAGVQTVAWFGTGPAENYADSSRAALVGRYTANVDDLVVNYAVPQESGHRADLRELHLPELGLTLETRRVAGRLPGFTLRRHTAEEVDAAAHPHELPASSATHLYLDAQQHGLGSRSCGMDVRPEYQLRPHAVGWELGLRLG